MIEKTIIIIDKGHVSRFLLGPFNSTSVYEVDVKFRDICGLVYTDFCLNATVK